MAFNLTVKVCYGGTYQPTISETQATHREGEVDYIKARLERDDGIYIYDVEFRKGFTEYNADIKADDGRIVEWDVDFDD